MIVLVTGSKSCENYFLIWQRVKHWHTEVEPITLLVMDGDGNPNHAGAGGRGGRAAKELGIETVAVIDGIPIGGVDLVLAFFEKGEEKELGKSDTVREALRRGIAVEVAGRDRIRFPYTGPEGE